MRARKSLKNPAVFLDRDGTINEEMGYINHPARFQLLPGVTQGIKLLNQEHFLTIVVTNQAGVARGYFQEDMVKTVHDRLYKELRLQGAAIDGIYYCPHHPSAGKPPYRQQCNCRKPLPGMIHQACEDFSIDLSQSYLIGDRYKDILFAKQFPLTAVMVLTGYGKGEYEFQRQDWKVNPDYIAGDFLSAVQWIITRHDRSRRDSIEQ